MKEQILAIVQGKPSSTRGIGALLHRRRVDVAAALRTMAAEGFVEYDAAHRRWRIPEAPAAAREPQTPAAPVTTQVSSARVIFEDSDVRVIEDAPGSFRVQAPAHRRPAIIAYLRALAIERLEADVLPLTARDRRMLHALTHGDRED